MNITGIKPVEYKVLIQVDAVEDKSAGGLFLPDDARAKQQYATTRGMLVDAGGLAFCDWKGTIPQLGDRVIFSKYAGTEMTHETEDRKRTQFRMCNDKDIVAILEKENE